MATPEEIEIVAVIVYREVAASDPYGMDSARDVALEILEALESLHTKQS
jgi:hypothetical protein